MKTKRKTAAVNRLLNVAEDNAWLCKTFSEFYRCTGNECNAPSLRALLQALHTEHTEETSAHNHDVRCGTETFCLHNVCLSSPVYVDFSGLPEKSMTDSEKSQKDKNVTDYTSHQRACVPVFQSAGTKGSCFLNVGFPVWSMDFSPPIVSHDNHGQTEAAAPEGEAFASFTVLAIGGTPSCRPVNRSASMLDVADSNEIQQANLLQLWKIPFTFDVKPQLVMGLRYAGGFCRSLAWARHSNIPGAYVGLLFTAYGDGTVNCYSIPLHYFLGSTTETFRCIDLPPIWQCTPMPFFTCVAPAPFFTPPISKAWKQSANTASTLRVATGTNNGRVLIWCLKCDTSGVETLGLTANLMAQFTIADTVPITSVAWVPVPMSPLIAASSMTGVVKVWDTRKPLDGCLHQLECSRRPVYHVFWPPVTRFLYASHTCAWIFNSVTKDCHQRPTGAVDILEGIPELRNEQPPWGCSGLLRLALFACDQGQLLIHPIDRLERNPESFQWRVKWSVIELSETNHIDQTSTGSNQPHFRATAAEKNHKLEGITLPSKCVNPPTAATAAASNSDSRFLLLRQFYREASEFYAESMFPARQPEHCLKLSVTVGKAVASSSILPTAKRSKNVMLKASQSTNSNKKAAQKDTDNVVPVTQHFSSVATPRLHAVCVVDPAIYPLGTEPLIAAAGSVGLVHIFNPARWCA